MGQFPRHFIFPLYLRVLPSTGEISALLQRDKTRRKNVITCRHHLRRVVRRLTPKEAGLDLEVVVVRGLEHGVEVRGV